MSEVLCPKCGSNQINAGNKGFSGKKAIAGTIITGGIGGALAGAVGSDKVKITCLSCGHEFEPGQGATSKGDFVRKKRADKKDKARFAKIILVITVIVIFYKACGGDSEVKNGTTESVIDSSAK